VVVIAARKSHMWRVKKRKRVYLFEIPKIFEEIKMSDYAPEFGEVVLKVWVNPPMKLLSEINELAKEITAERISKEAEIIGKIWDEPAEKVMALVEHASETDPKLFTWMIFRTFKVIQEHRGLVKKNWTQEFLS